MDPDKDILNLIKQIKDTIEINDQAVLGGQAITKCKNIFFKCKTHY